MQPSKWYLSQFVATDYSSMSDPTQLISGVNVALDKMNSFEMVQE